MVRKLAAAMLGVGVFVPGLANALGLGEIKLNSALSEPLDAEIELVQVRELTATEILPSLASSDDFSSSNIERFHFLTDLKFEVIVNAQGKSVIKVRSRKPVKEPFLNFLVEVNWPAGRLLREYTLLLDPPIYSQQKAEPVKQAQTSAPTAPPAKVPTYQPATSPQTTYTADTYSSSSSSGQVQTHTIGSNDSLWSIARDMKPSDRVSIQQTMMAIQRINPDAFIDGNINLLKRGQVLRAPTEEEALQLTNQEAIAMAAEQNRQWQQRGSSASSAPEARQIDLTGRSVDRESDPAPESSDARLKLVSGSSDGSDGSGQGGEGGQSGQLRDQLAVAEENIDKFKLENDELKLKVTDLEDQLDTSEKVLSLKDEQIAALQAKLRELEAQQAAGAQVSDAAPMDDALVDEPADEMASEMEPPEEVLAGGLASEEAADEFAEAEAGAGEEVDFNYQDDSEPLAGEESGELAGDVEEADPFASVEQPEPAQETESEAQQTAAQIADQIDPNQGEQDLVQQILSNPMYLAAGGGAILLILVLIVLASRRKSSSEDEMEEAAVEDFELPEAQSDEDVPEFDSVNLEEDDAFEEAVEASAEEETVPQTSDVIAEADIYIAYGRFPQAIEMLEKAAEGEPERSDIRLKLCEVCAEANEPATFMTHYGVLQTLGDAAAVAKADSLKDKLPDLDMDATLMASPEESVDMGTSEFEAVDLDTPETLEEDTPNLEASSEAADFDFDLGDDTSSDLNLDAPAESGVESELEQESDTGLDFDLGDLEDTDTSFEAASDFETTAEPEHPPAEPMTEEEQAAGEVAGLDFDLNLDLEDAESSSEAGATESPEASDASLDFDSDFSLDSVPDEQGADSVGDLDLDFDSLTTEEPGESEPAAELDLPDLDISGAEDSGSDVPDLEAPNLDVPEFDTPELEVPDLESADAEASAADTDFDLDFDVDAEPLEPGEETILAPTADQPASESAEEEPMLDSQSAAELASELDLDLDADFLTEEAPAAPALDAGDDDATIIADLNMAETAPAANDLADTGEELDFLSDADEASTKLDLARAYIDMGDRDGAKDILDEVMLEGNDGQKQEAKDLLTRLES